MPWPFTLSYYLAILLRELAACTNPTFKFDGWEGKRAETAEIVKLRITFSLVCLRKFVNQDQWTKVKIFIFCYLQSFSCLNLSLIIEFILPNFISPLSTASSASWNQTVIILKVSIGATLMLISKLQIVSFF